MGGFSGGPPGTVTPGGPPGTGRRPVAPAQKERVFDPTFATVAPRVDLEAPDIPVFDPRGGWAAVVDWWFSHDIPTEGLPSGGGLMFGPQEAAKGLNFLKDALLPLMAGDIGLAGVGGLGPFDPLPIPGGKIVGKGADVAKAGVRAVRGAVRGGDEAVEAAARVVRGDPAAGAWREGYEEAELVPIEFFDDMQLEDEFFDRDLVDERWVERPEAIEGKGMEGLKSDMAEHGLDHPLTVRVDPESGAMNLVDGNHRVVAARELGWGSVPVVVERGRGGGRVRPSQVGVPTAAGGVARETGEAVGVGQNWRSVLDDLASADIGDPKIPEARGHIGYDRFDGNSFHRVSLETMDVDVVRPGDWIPDPLGRTGYGDIRVVDEGAIELHFAARGGAAMRGAATEAAGRIPLNDLRAIKNMVDEMSAEGLRVRSFIDKNRSDLRRVLERMGFEVSETTRADGFELGTGVSHYWRVEKPAGGVARETGEAAARLGGEAAAPGVIDEPRWHGSPREFDEDFVLDWRSIDEEEDLLFGGGLYTASNKNVAAAHAGESGSVTQVVWTRSRPPRILDLDAPMTDDVRGVARQVAEETFEAGGFNVAGSTMGGIRGGERMAEYRRVLDDPASTWDDFYSLLRQDGYAFVDMRDRMMAIGVDAYRFQGGVPRVGSAAQRLDDPYEVTVWLDEDSIALSPPPIEGLLRGPAGD